MYYLIDKYGVRESTDSEVKAEVWRKWEGEGLNVQNGFLKVVDGSKVKHELDWGTGIKANCSKRGHANYLKNFKNSLCLNG